MSVSWTCLEVNGLTQYANTELDLSAAKRSQFDPCAVELDSNPYMVVTIKRALLLNCPHRLEARAVI